MKLQHNEWGDDEPLISDTEQQRIDEREAFAHCERSSKLSRPWLIWALFAALAPFALWYWPTLGAM